MNVSAVWLRRQLAVCRLSAPRMRPTDAAMLVLSGRDILPDRQRSTKTVQRRSCCRKLIQASGSLPGISLRDALSENRPRILGDCSYKYHCSMATIAALCCLYYPSYIPEVCSLAVCPRGTFAARFYRVCACLSHLLVTRSCEPRMAKSWMGLQSGGKPTIVSTIEFSIS